MTLRHVWKVEVQLHSFLALPLDESNWSASCPSCLIPRKAPPVATEIEGWVGSRAGLNISEENDLLPLLGFEPRFLGLPDHSLGTVLWNICTSNLTYFEVICVIAPQLYDCRDTVAYLPK